MPQQLYTDIAVALAGSANTTVAHGLLDNNGALTPSSVLPDRASPIVVTAVDNTNVTFTNGSSGPASATFRAQREATITARPALGSLLWQGGGAGSGLSGLVAVAVSPYNVQAGDRYLLVDAVPMTINLQAVADATSVLTVKDRTGSCSAGTPITIAAAPGQTIDGEGTLVLDGPYASVTLVPSGTEWSVV